MGAHAVLSASGANRWIACPPSARLEELVEDQGSVFAEEGTLAHALADLDLKKRLGRLTAGEHSLARTEVEINPLFSPEMSDYVDEYVDMVAEKIRILPGEAVVLLEERLDYSHLVPEGFGTGDVVLVHGGAVEVIDFKYGKGVAVEAEENPQMRLYALGALEAFDMLYDIRTVKTTVVQPRLNSVSCEEISSEKLLAWAEAVVRPAAVLAWAGEGVFSAGEHCRFCKVRFTCRARADANLELAKYDFVDPALLTAEEIADVLGKAAELKNWVTDIAAYALDRAENHGDVYPGYKLVEGRSNRKYTDEGLVASVLIQAGYDETTIFEKKLLGITGMEKVVGKKTVGVLLKDYLVKPPGKPTLVPVSDKRLEISSAEAAKNDFKED